MKKLTIFRTCEYATLTGKLLRESACKIVAQAKEVRKTFGETRLIVSSHVPEAMNSARLIQRVMENAQILDQPRLSRYHAGSEDMFKADFLSHVRHCCSYCDHIILVSHGMNISAITGEHVSPSSSITLEAEKWSAIFELETNSMSLQTNRLAEKGFSLDSIANELSEKEKALIASLPYVEP